MDIVLPVVVVVGMALLLKFGVRRVTVLEYEKGLKYAKGKFVSVLEPGQYGYLPFFTTIQKIDIRPRFASIAGQEVLSADGVTIKVSLAANFEISDPYVAINKVQSYQQALYLELQLGLREIIGSEDIDSVLSGRGALSKKLTELTEPKAASLGLKLISVDLKDIMFPGKLKEVFAQVVSARKEGLAALEKARGESAALRNLANAAKILEGNPNLMQLRLLKALGESSGNTLILGMPSASVPVPVATTKDKKTKAKQKNESQEP
jgi:regulator of protease activity HflC (stomatin/prohibitin superfamily)